MHKYTLMIIIPIVFLVLTGCKSDPETEKWKHAKTLETQRQMHKDKLWTMRKMAETAQEHARRLKDKFYRWSGVLLKFLSVIGVIAGLIWSGMKFYAKWTSEKLVQAFRIEEVRQEQVTLREKNKLALAYLFDPVIFAQLGADERKCLIADIGRETRKIEKLETDEPIVPPKKHNGLPWQPPVDYLKKIFPVKDDVKSAMDQFKSKGDDDAK